jgi:hypothetical protein
MFGYTLLRGISLLAPSKGRSYNESLFHKFEIMSKRGVFNNHYSEKPSKVIALLGEIHFLS